MQTIPRDTLRDFLARFAATGAEFPRGARMNAAGHYHGDADANGNGLDYSRDEVAHAIAEWVSARAARAYLTGYNIAVRPTAYSVRFVPTDPNADDENATTWDTLRDARTHIARDANAYAANHRTHGDDAEAHAYATTATEALHPRAAEGTYPVTVTHGDNRRTIGSYVITQLREGTPHPCTHCNAPGIVTAIHGGGNIIACCPTHRVDEAHAMRQTLHTCPTCGMDAWDCAAHHGDTHYTA